MKRAALLVLLPLAGCASGGWDLTQGGLRDEVTSFASDHSTSFSCSRYDAATGNLIDQVTIQRNLNPNAASVAAIAGIAQGLIGLAKAAPVAALGARQGETARAAPPLTIAACLGEHGINAPMPPPPDPMPSQQQSSSQTQNDTRAVRPFKQTSDAGPRLQAPEPEPVPQGPDPNALSSQAHRVPAAVRGPASVPRSASIAHAGPTFAPGRHDGPGGPRWLLPGEGRLVVYERPDGERRVMPREWWAKWAEGGP